MYYPAMLDLSHFKIYVVGGGRVALGKVQGLLKCGGKVTVISPSLCEALAQLKDEIEWIPLAYEAGLLEAATLVVAATNDLEVNKAIGESCKAKHILCNVATSEALSSFIVPSFVQRGDLVLSVSSGGKSPTLTKKIKRELEVRYDEQYGHYVELLGRLREQIKVHISDEKERRKMLNHLVQLSYEALKEEEKLLNRAFQKRIH